MNILITGANFNNKGAQLMLVSLVTIMRKKLPPHKVCVSPLLGNRKQLQEMGVHILDYPLYHFGTKHYFKRALQYPTLMRWYLGLKKRDTSGDIPLKAIDVVFDISGFAFGDKWGPIPVEYLDLFVSKMKRQNTKVFLLPQAFGPFSGDGMRKHMQHVIEQVDLLIARDQQSYAYVTALHTQPRSNVALYPDITLSYKQPMSITDEVFAKPFVAIVPNERMLDKASEGWQKNYYQVMAKIIHTVLENSSLNVGILIHAGGASQDKVVGKTIQDAIAAEYADRVFYYMEEDPSRLKSIIAKSTFLVGSRFHALASALSSNVPAIGTSWLHKYEMLFEDYGISAFSFKEPTDDIYEKVLALIHPDTRNDQIDVLKSNNANIHALHERMWHTIMDKL